MMIIQDIKETFRDGWYWFSARRCSVTGWLSFQLSAGINKRQALWLTLEQVKQGPYILKYKAHISTQADDNIVSSLTLKLRYSNNTQHTAFFFFFFLNIVANKRKITNWQDTKYTKVPRLEKMVMYYKHCLGCGTVQQPWLLRERERLLFSTIDPSWRWSSLHWSLWHCTDSVSLYEIIDDGNVNYLVCFD